MKKIFLLVLLFQVTLLAFTQSWLDKIVSLDFDEYASLLYNPVPNTFEQLNPSVFYKAIENNMYLVLYSEENIVVVVALFYNEPIYGVFESARNHSWIDIGNNHSQIFFERDEILLVYTAYISGLYGLGSFDTYIVLFRRGRTIPEGFRNLLY